MRSGLGRTVLACFAGALVLLLAVGVAGWRSTIRLREDAALDARSRDVLTRLALLMGAVNDVETAERGYTVTGDDLFLVPREAGEQQAREALVGLQSQFARDTAQQQRLRGLEALVVARVARSRSNVELRRTRGFEAARAATVAGTGRQLQDAIRRGVGEMRRVETALLNRRQEDASRSTRQALAVIVAGSLLSLFFAGSALIMFSHGAVVRAQSEAALRASEDRFRRAVLQSPFPVLLHADDGAIIQASDSWCELTGYSRSELATIADWTERAYGERKAVVQAEIDALYGMEHRKYEGDYAIRIKDGSERIWEFSSAPLGRLPDGRRLVSSMALDVTARRQTEDALRESESRFRQLANSLPQLVWTCEPDGPCDFLSQPWVAYTGIPESQQLGFGWLDQLHDDDRAPTVAAWQAAVDSGSDFLVEFRIRRHDGEYRWFDTRAVRLRDASGSTVKWFGSNTDITERKYAATLLDVQARMAAVFLTIPDDAMFDEALRIVLSVTQSPLGVFGYLDESGTLVVPTITGRASESCQVPGQSLRIPRAAWRDSSWSRAIREKRVVLSNAPSPDAPVGQVGCLRHISLPLVSQGEVIGLIQVANKELDYTEVDVQLLGSIAGQIAPLLSARLLRDRAEQKLQRRNRDLETLLHVTSHDLREPLRSLQAFSRMVAERYAAKLDAKGQDFLRRVVSGAERLERLLDDVLQLARVQRMEAPLEGVSARALVDEALRRLEFVINETHARVHVDADLSTLRVNGTWATQALYNLVANALKFTRAGEAPDVEIGSWRSDGELGFVVRDRGPGVSPEHADRIFLLFQRAVGREVPGTGAGLAIVHQVAERHGGRAWVQPRAGGGSEFVITFANT